MKAQIRDRLLIVGAGPVDVEIGPARTSLESEVGSC